MQIGRFLGNIARAYLAIGAVSASALVVADEYPLANNSNWGEYAPHHDYGYLGGNAGCDPCNCNEGPQCDWGYNPPAYLRCGGGGCGQNGFLDSLRLRLDFLWWRANAEGIALGLERELTQFPSDNIFLTERTKKPNFKYDPGFRLGLATVCECVDIGLNWTHYHTKAKARGNSDFSNLNPSVTTPPASVTEFFSFWEKFNEFTPEAQRGRWSLTMDLLDLEIGHKYFVSSCFVLRPHLGLRGARLDQSYRTTSFANRTLFGDVFESNSRSTCDFLGIGPRLGVDAEWRIGCGLSVFGQAAGSILFGKNRRHAREEFNNGLTAPDFAVAEYASNGSSDRVSRAVTDLSIGLKWEHCFELCCRQHPFSLAFSWEHHGFYSFENFDFRSSVSPVDFTDAGVAGLTPDIGSRKYGDLFTQGLTVTAEFGF